MPIIENTNGSPNVQFIRYELAKLLPQYKLIRDTLSGEMTVKEQGRIYLPMPDSTNTSPENQERYSQYKLRAVFYNVTRRTLSGLIGQVFMRDPIIKLPEQLAHFEADVSGGGISLTQSAKKSLAMTLAYSRSGLFIDYPKTEKGASVKEIQEGTVRPTMTTFSPIEIINWRETEIGAVKKLSLVVIAELFPAQDDGFEIKTGCQYRVLRLINGVYSQEIWREDIPTLRNEITGDTSYLSEYKMQEIYFPLDANGNNLTEIPFKFIGSENNDPAPDNPNFYDLASLNIAHYRNSADYEESCYIVGQPTIVTTGLTEEWLKNVLNNKISFGSRGGVPLPVGADAKLIQAVPNTMLFEAMETKERQMVALGAKLVEQKQVQRTAFETKVEATSEGSILSSTTKNVNSAYDWGIKFAAKWLGIADTTIQFELNTDFDIARMTPEEQKQIVDDWQKGAITFEEMRTGLRKAGVVYEDDATAKASIEKDMAAQMALVAENTPADNQNNGGV